MRRNKLKILSLCMAVTLAMSGLTGCTDKSETSVNTEISSTKNTFAYTEDTDTELKSTSIEGRVTEVNGNEITLTIGGGMGGAPGDGQPPSGGQPPNGSQPPSGGQPPKSESGGSQPSGNAGGGTPPEMKEGSEGILTISDESVLAFASQDEKTQSSAAATLTDIIEGTMITITFDENGNISQISISEDGMQMGMGGNQPSGVDSYTAVTEYSEDTTVTGESFESTGTDENAILVSNGANVTLNNITLTRNSSDSTGGDNSSFYGVGAGLLTTDGTTYVNGGTFTTDASGGTGIFSYNKGKTYVANALINTTQNTSGGIHVAGGGTLYAWDLDVETDGESAAAIRSDRGGGTMVIDGGTYTSNGVGSPALYCTADISVNDAELTATGSEAICMEGLNSIHLFDCDITGDMDDLEQNDTTWTIIVYQSMSGDSEVGNSTMQIVGGNLASKNGGLIYTTNTESNILLSDVDITYADDSEFFLQCTGNNNKRGWGTSGANGSDCVFTADNQEMLGDIIWDSISNLDFYMMNGSSLSGAFLDDETCAENTGDGQCNVYISADSTWTVAGNSTITNLYNEGKIVDESGKTVTIKGSDGTVYVQGNSNLTITVETYGTSADFSNAAQAYSWSNHEVEKPEELL